MEISADTNFPRNDKQIQRTNDFSSVSKHSMSSAGYLEDRFLQHFVAKKVKRAPIINRGYFARMKAIDTVILDFLKDAAENSMEVTETETDDDNKQRLNIIVLGAGYDTLFFRLHDQHKELMEHFDLCYIEIDFLDVCTNKSQMIQLQPEMLQFLPGITAGSVDHDGFTAVLTSRDYTLVGFDLRKAGCLPRLFDKLRMDCSAPTFILSEVVLTYIDDSYVVDIFKTMADSFQNALFCNYEQVEPNDAFGVFMQQHFQKQNSPLLNIHRYPTVESHVNRFLDAGWTATLSLSMSDFWARFVSEEERLRINLLEPFDEHEEFMEKMRHYALVLAATGGCCDVVDNYHYPASKEESAKAMLRASMELATIYPVPLPDKFSIYSHAIVEVKLTKMFGESVNVVILIGGVSKPKESDLPDGVCALEDLGPGLKGIWISTSQLDSTLKRPLVHHAAFPHPTVNNIIFVTGGRTSPVSPNLNVYAIELTLNENAEEIAFSVRNGKKLALLNSEQGSIRCLTVPLAEDKVALAVQSLSAESQSSSLDYFQYELKNDDFSITQIPIDTIYPARFCSVSTWDEHRLVLTGGLRDDITVSSVFLFDIESHAWPFLGEMTFPRFGHTSHIYGDFLIVIGGVSHLSSHIPDVSVFHLSTKAEKHFKLQFPPTAKESLVMLFNHTSLIITRNEPKRIMIFGGGGNCFSFGTHFNAFPFYIELSALL